LRDRQPEREERGFGREERTKGGCIDPDSYDAGRKIKGKKRYIPVDTIGLLLHAIVHPAGIQDRDGGVYVMTAMFGLSPLLQKLFAGGGYQGPKFHDALAKALPGLSVTIVKRSGTATGFQVLPRRWFVERTLRDAIDAAGSPGISRT